MSNEKKAFFEEVSLSDAMAAQTLKDECERKLERGKIGMWVAAAVPLIDALCVWILMSLELDDLLLAVLVVVALAAYILGGGLVSALKMVWKVTWTAYRIIPIFPWDLLVGFCALAFAGGIALMFPIIFVLLSRYQLTMNKEAAEKFLQMSQPAAATVGNQAVFNTNAMEE